MRDNDEVKKMELFAVIVFVHKGFICSLAFTITVRRKGWQVSKKCSQEHSFQGSFFRATTNK